MTDQRQPPPGPGPQASPDPLRLRARPQPVTRISRRVVIGGAALLLVLLISMIVLLALKPPGLHVGSPQELFNVDYKPVTDALSKLPATYDGVQTDKRADTGKQPGAPSVVLKDVPVLKAPAADPVAEAERLETARLAQHRRLRPGARPCRLDDGTGRPPCRRPTGGARLQQRVSFM